jgi:glycosyltransferase involved in cell wall biosynthesis
MRIALMLPGSHHVSRGAEVAFESLAAELTRSGEDVTLFGSGPAREDRSYRYQRSGLIRRERFERFPKIRPFHADHVFEELTWAAGVLRHYRAADFDVTATCSFPFVNWLATHWPPLRRARPPHVFVTQNGDYPAFRQGLDYRLFDCDGLVCTNPLYYERQRTLWRSTLLPNGVDTARFKPGPAQRERFRIPEGVPAVLMVSALTESKRVLDVMGAVASVPDGYLVVAGDGPLRDRFDEMARTLLRGRSHRLVVPSEQMPDLYRSADVVLHPTLLESFGNVYIEAMATAVPVVAHDSIVTRWIMGEEHPGLVDTTDPALDKSAIDSALSSDRAGLDTRAAAVAARFSWQTVADGYRAFFREVVDARDATSD